MILLKLISLIPIARDLLIAMAIVGLWTGRDVLVRVPRLRASNAGMAGPVVKVLRWKLVILSGLAAAELVLCLVAATAA
jgi:hypothetical protein